MPSWKTSWSCIARASWPAYDVQRRYVLLEMAPLVNGLAILKETVFRLRLEGAVPVLAHPERLDFLDRLADVEGLRNQGRAPNHGACLLAPGSSSCRRATEWVHRGWVQVVASDAHDPVRRPRMAAARHGWRSGKGRRAPRT